jgi:hypothetical protein
MSIHVYYTTDQSVSQLVATGISDLLGKKVCYHHSLATVSAEQVHTLTFFFRQFSQDRFVLSLLIDIRSAGIFNSLLMSTRGVRCVHLGVKHGLAQDRLLNRLHSSVSVDRQRDLTVLSLGPGRVGFACGKAPLVKVTIDGLSESLLDPLLLFITIRRNSPAYIASRLAIECRLQKPMGFCSRFVEPS